MIWIIQTLYIKFISFHESLNSDGKQFHQEKKRTMINYVSL
jgi:hypothetical protein